jgi:hypothetical protein
LPSIGGTTRPGGGAGAPPGIDAVEQLRVRLPAVDRQAEGGLADKGIAAHRLEGRAGWIKIEFVIARHHPDLAAMFDPHLRRAQHMTGWMQRDLHAADIAPWP